MLVQTYRRDVPDHDAWIERTLLRSPSFCVAVIRSRRLAMDPGVVRLAQSHLALLRRPQLTIVLSGRGYLEVDGRTHELGPGDVAATDQRSHLGEGYGGAAAEVVVIDWDGDLVPVRGRLDARALCSVRALVDRVGTPSAELWISELAGILRDVLGVAMLPADPREIAASPPALRQIYAALGPALSRLDRHPSLDDVAAATGTSERQAHRLLSGLARDYDHPYPGWRELVHGMRIGWATQILSLPGVPLDRVASLAGYRSTVAMHHAYSLRGAPTPRTVALELRSRWR